MKLLSVGTSVLPQPMERGAIHGKQQQLDFCVQGWDGVLVLSTQQTSLSMAAMLPKSQCSHGRVLGCQGVRF